MDKGTVVCIHNEIFSHGKKDEILSIVAKWMELENITLIEISKIKKDGCDGREVAQTMYIHISKCKNDEK
jgi:hypothetical protein